MKYFLFIISLLAFQLVFAQMPGMPGGMKNMKDPKMGRVFGKVLDASTGQPVEYASVQVLWFSKDSLLNGGLVKANGDFSVDGLPSFGQVRVKIKFIGYEDYLQKVFLVPPDKIELDLGNIKLKPDDKLLKEVDVVAEKSAVVLSIDKRTYNVDKDLSVKGGTAVDVMQNIPGLTVDADGGVQLRNQSPTIFVDGRPTNLTLQQIPADQIERVEIITNPSVKFEASSTGGILNIILKKNLKPGYNGIIMANIGTGDRYGGMGNINLKDGKWNLSLMYNYNQAINNTQGYTNRTQLDSNIILGYFNQNNQSRFANAFNFGRIGLDYSINNRNTISLNGMIVAGKFKTHDDQSFEALDDNKVMRIYGDRVNNQNAQFQNYNAQVMYKKTFPKVGKEITADVSYNYTNSDNSFLFITSTKTNPDTVFLPNEYQKNKGGTNANQFVFQLDYVNPLSETRKFEAGVRAFYKNSVSFNNATRATFSEEFYQRDSILSNRYLIDDMVNAAYINYNDKIFWNIGYQAGLRLEQSYYKGNIVDRNQSFSYNYPSSSQDILNSLFPGIYFSKKLKKNQELQLNFSRKIQRPNFFQLMPFVLFADRQNYRIGNPELRPEFRNIAELNYNKIFTKGSYLGSGYFRYEEQPITDIAYPSPNPSEPNVLINTTINGSNAIKYGMEHTIKWNLIKNLDLTLNGNVFYIYLRGKIVPTEPEVTAKGYAYNAKTTLAYKFPKQFTLQINGNYESPRILLLGYSQPMYGMDISANKMIGTKWIFNATLSDVFNTRRMGAHFETPYYIQDLSRRRESRFVRFSVTYIFGKMDASIFKRGKQMRGLGDQNQGSQDGLDFK